MQNIQYIQNIQENFFDVAPLTRSFLQYAMSNPNENIPVYPKSKTLPEAEIECRALVSELRDLEIDGVQAYPVFQICHVERDKIWCDFTLNPDLIGILLGNKLN
ncbi:MAG: hypothetical protein R3Y63_08850 [Eubacteriales bacterium]